MAEGPEISTSPRAFGVPVGRPRTTVRGVASLVAVTTALTVILSGGASAAAIAALGAGPGVHATVVYYTPAPAPSALPFSHFVIAIQENHAFDTYFGTYCQTLGPYCTTVPKGIPPGLCMPYNATFPGRGCLKPYPFPNVTSVTTDPQHTWPSSLAAYDHGAMDGFLSSNRNNSQVMGYYNGSTIPTYWNYAEQYGIGDDFFSSAHSASIENHWYLLAGKAPPVLNGALFTTDTNPQFRHKYLNESNTTAAISDLLVNSTLNWKIYSDTLSTTWNAALHSGNVYSYWEPLQAKNETYSSAFRPHFVYRTNFLTDAAKGTLPNYSYIAPNLTISEHPTWSPATGEAWLNQVFQSVESSPEWNSTVVFLTYDEYGGFFDTVAPPQIDAAGLGFRVPLIAVSAYSRPNYVDDQYAYFEALDKLVEYKFGLANLSATEANSTLLTNFFDFNATPRAPFTPTNASLQHYPLAFQTLGAPKPPANLKASVVPGGVRLNWTEPVGGAPITRYQLYFGPLAHPKQSTIRIDGAADGIQVGNLVSGVTYSFSLSSFSAQTVSSIVSLNHTAGPARGAGLLIGDGGLGPSKSASTAGLLARWGELPARDQRANRPSRL